MACVLLEMNLLQNILITAVFPEANPKRCQLQKKLTSVCVVVVQIDTQALCWLDRPEMGHKRVTVQQRLLRDWSMEMGGGACGETRATKQPISVRKARLPYHRYDKIRYM